MGGGERNVECPTVIVVGPNCTAEGETPDPFNVACTGTVSDALQVMLCVTNNALATDDLVNHCEANTTVTNEVCVTSGVNANPFHVICNETYLPTIKQTQKTYADFCADTANPVPLGGATCPDVVNNCIANPFHGTGVGCDAEVYVNVRITFCTKTDIFNADCGVLDRATAEVVTGTYAARATACVNNTAAAGIAVGLNSAACVANGAGFTAWADSGASPLDAGGAVDSGDDANFIRGELKPDGTLNLGAGITTANNATLTLNDDGKNGFAIGSNAFDSGTKLYAGLLSTTEGVGAPYNTDVMDATWSGKLAYILGSTLSVEQDFELTVNFDGSGGRISGTVGDVSDGQFVLSGNFTGTGSNLITEGRVLYTNNGNLVTDAAGTLTGLIGVDGAIAVFKSDDAANDADNFVGGFVVKAPADQTNCDADGTPFDPTCTDYNAQAKACLANNVAAMVDFCHELSG